MMRLYLQSSMSTAYAHYNRVTSHNHLSYPSTVCNIQTCYYTKHSYPPLKRVSFVFLKKSIKVASSSELAHSPHVRPTMDSWGAFRKRHGQSACSCFGESLQNKSSKSKSLTGSLQVLALWWCMPDNAQIPAGAELQLFLLSQRHPI